MISATPVDTLLIGRRILAFDQVDSTNSVAAAHATDVHNDGLVIVAEEQTAGRGRHGRAWLSPPGEGLLVSVLVFPPEHLRRPVVLTGLAAVAVCDTIYACTRLQGTIKWPNDVLVQGRKVSGILVEQGRGLVIGIGLNVNTRAEAFTQVGLTGAASLALCAGRQLAREQVLLTLIRQLDAYYHDLLRGQEGDLESRWRWHSGLLGRQAALHAYGQVHRGRILELAFDGILLQETAGVLRRFTPETVEHITPLPETGPHPDGRGPEPRLSY